VVGSGGWWLVVVVCKPILVFSFGPNQAFGLGLGLGPSWTKSAYLYAWYITNVKQYLLFWIKTKLSCGFVLSSSLKPIGFIQNPCLCKMDETLPNPSDQLHPQHNYITSLPTHIPHSQIGVTALETLINRHLKTKSKDRELTFFHPITRTTTTTITTSPKKGHIQETEGADFWYGSLFQSN
jgi:hypothetical protein